MFSPWQGHRGDEPKAPHKGNHQQKERNRQGVDVRGSNQTHGNNKVCHHLSLKRLNDWFKKLRLQGKSQVSTPGCRSFLFLDKEGHWDRASTAKANGGGGGTEPRKKFSSYNKSREVPGTRT